MNCEIKPQSLAELFDQMASAQPLPAGGSAVALATAMAAAITSKAARRSRKHWAQASDAIDRAESVRLRAMSLVNEDAAVYADVIQASR